MICSKMQGLKNKLNSTRDRKKAAYYRRRMRDHAQKCGYCRKGRQGSRSLKS